MQGPPGCVQLQPDPFMVLAFSPAGSGSFKVTVPVVAAVPLLVTVMLYVPVCPWVKGLLAGKTGCNSTRVQDPDLEDGTLGHAEARPELLPGRDRNAHQKRAPVTSIQIPVTEHLRAVRIASGRQALRQEAAIAGGLHGLAVGRGHRPWVSRRSG